jgi:hypothetical protein
VKAGIKETIIGGGKEGKEGRKEGREETGLPVLLLLRL